MPLGLVGGAALGSPPKRKLWWGEDEQRSERAFAAGAAEAKDAKLVRTTSLPLMREVARRSRDGGRGKHDLQILKEKRKNF